MNSRQIGGVVLGERGFERTKRTTPGSATARSWKSTLWRASFEDITSIRLVQRVLAVEPLPFRYLARTSSPQQSHCTDVRVTYGY